MRRERAAIPASGAATRGCVAEPLTQPQHLARRLAQGAVLVPNASPDEVARFDATRAQLTPVIQAWCDAYPGVDLEELRVAWNDALIPFVRDRRR